MFRISSSPCKFKTLEGLHPEKYLLESISKPLSDLSVIYSIRRVPVKYRLFILTIQLLEPKGQESLYLIPTPQ